MEMETIKINVINTSYLEPENIMIIFDDNKLYVYFRSRQFQFTSKNLGNTQNRNYLWALDINIFFYENDNESSQIIVRTYHDTLYIHMYLLPEIYRELNLKIEKWKQLK